MPSLRCHTRSRDRLRPAAPWAWMLALLTAWAVLAIGIGSASPEVHSCVHHDADQPEHVCAITLASAGYCDTSAEAPSILHGQSTLRPVRFAPESHAWRAPHYWLIPAQAPPAVRV